MAELNVKVPKGLSGGDSMQVEHGGSLFNVTVPPGLSTGDEFVAKLPAAPPTPAYTVAPPSSVPVGMPVAAGSAMPQGNVYTGQPVPGRPVQGYGQQQPGGYGHQPGGYGGVYEGGAELPPCRGCGRHFVRAPGVRPNTAQYYRCPECATEITFCSLM
jgi:hypothetical protein